MSQKGRITERVGIIGGGISGLSASYYALQRGCSVKLFEASGQLGGLAASFDFKEISLEKYYHFICGRDAEHFQLARELGLERRLKFQHTRAFFFNANYYPFGSAVDLLRFSLIPPLSRLRFGINIVISKYRKKWEKLDGISAKECLTH